MRMPCARGNPGRSERSWRRGSSPSPLRRDRCAPYPDPARQGRVSGAAPQPAAAGRRPPLPARQMAQPDPVAGRRAPDWLGSRVGASSVAPCRWVGDIDPPHRDHMART